MTTPILCGNKSTCQMTWKVETLSAASVKDLYMNAWTLQCVDVRQDEFIELRLTMSYDNLTFCIEVDK